MTIEKKDRDTIEEAILDAQMMCEKFLDTPRQTSFVLFERSVLKMLSTLDEHSQELQSDGKRDNYKLHAFVPLQTYYMQLSLNEKNKEKSNDD